MKKSNKYILIVDDIHINRLLIKTIINSYGYEHIHESFDGQDAIKKVEDFNYDIIFMDIQMPIMDGIKATEYIRQKLNSKIPIIAITAYLDIETDDKGFNDVVRKPYTVEKIKKILDTYLKNTNK